MLQHSRSTASALIKSELSIAVPSQTAISNRKAKDFILKSNSHIKPKAFTARTIQNSAEKSRTDSNNVSIENAYLLQGSVIEENEEMARNNLLFVDNEAEDV